MATCNKRSSLLLSSLSAIDTSFTSPAITNSPSVFSSATISSVASSVSPQPTDLKHPSPRRYSARHSPFLKTDDVEVRTVSPPARPLSPLSPIVAKNFLSTTFLDFDSDSEDEMSPQSAHSEYFDNIIIARPQTGFR